MTKQVDTPCAITVANAAPLTPMPNPLINMASSTILVTAPTATLHILIKVFPCAVINAFNPNVSIYFYGKR